MYNMRILGNSCYMLAKEHNISPEKIAEAIGCTEEQVNKIFYGRCYMSYRQLEIMASLFGLNVKELLDWDEVHNKSGNIVGLHTFGPIEEYDKDSLHMMLDIVDDYVTLREECYNCPPALSNVTIHRRYTRLVPEELKTLNISLK